MLVNFERIDAWQQRRFPTSDHSDEMAGRSTSSEYRWFMGEVINRPEVRLGPRCPQFRDRDSAGPSLAAIVT
jgi:hypothetical protein